MFKKHVFLGKLKSINVSKCKSEEMEERVKALEVRLRKLEDSVELRCSEVELLEKRVKVFEVRLGSVEDDVELAVSQDELNEGDRKIELFEEKIEQLGEKVLELYKYVCEQRG